jgi:tRNA (guanine37-N1)-methyltransferase
MRIDIITLFPEMFTGPFSESIIKRAQAAGQAEIHLHQLRDYAIDKHGTVDDTPYGGGAGMVLKVDVMDAALTAVKTDGPADVKPHILLMTPQGEPFKQQKARQLAEHEWLIILCGHYEGFDERIRVLVDQEVSIGDYVLTGGELAAMVITDAVIRLLPGVLGKQASHEDDSHENGLLEYPHYTRPDEYNGQGVPDVLKSGNHAVIEKWRREQSLERTKTRRPDLLDS